MSTISKVVGYYSPTAPTTDPSTPLLQQQDDQGSRFAIETREQTCCTKNKQLVCMIVAGVMLLSGAVISGIILACHYSDGACTGGTAIRPNPH